MAQSTSYDANTIPIGGINSVGIGFQAGFVNVGNQNVFTGYRSGSSNTTGYNNVFSGAFCLINALINFCISALFAVI